MTDIVVANVPPSLKRPGSYISIVFGGGAATARDQPKKLLLLGNKTGALTGATPSFSFPAGTADLNKIYSPASEQEVIDLFGAGGEIHLEYLEVQRQGPNIQIECMAFGEAAGAVKASQTIVLAGTDPTSAISIRVHIDGRAIERAYASGTLQDDIGLDLCSAINSETSLPVTAQYTAGTNTITVTAKNGGTRGNTILLRLSVILGSQVTVLRTGTLAGTVAGLTLTLGGGKLAGGTGTETTTFTSALTALDNMLHDYVVASVVDATNVTALSTHMSSKNDANKMLWQQGIVAVVEDLTTATVGAQAIATAANNPRIQVVWQYNSERHPAAIAAAKAVARLAGDSRANGTDPGELSSPQINHDGCIVMGVPPQYDRDDQPANGEVEIALSSGVSPLVPSLQYPSGTEIVRSVTSKFKDATGAFNYSTIDTSDVTIIDTVAREIRSVLNTTYPHHNIVNDDPETGAPPEKLAARTVTPSMIRDVIVGVLTLNEEGGLITEVERQLKELQVVRSSSARGRVGIEVPVEPVVAFHQSTANVRQRQPSV